jgi:hypothetical protein
MKGGSEPKELVISPEIIGTPPLFGEIVLVISWE